jgi:DNA modification methylase
VYQWHAHRRQALVEEAWKAAGLLAHQQIIWVKARAVLTRSHYLWQHEPAFYGWPQGKMPEKPARPAPNLTTVWQIDQVGQQGGFHPTQKPTRIFEIPIEQHTKRGDVVLESFSGSGTQIIAAEKLGRRCHAMELAPGYVDVAVRRWETATGKQAVLDGTEQTFAEVAAERGAEPGTEPATPEPQEAAS